MADADTISSILYRLIEGSPSHHVLGSSLAVLLKRAYPDFRPEDFGSRNLREFIRAYAKEVYEVGRSGGDVVYSLSRLPIERDSANASREFMEIPTVSQPTKYQLDRRVWKTFVSPSGTFVIWGNRNRGVLQVLPATHGSPHTSPGDDWVKIPPCPAEIHEQIAREFMATLPEGDAKSQLETVLGLNTSWWEHFFVSARNLGLEKQWSAFRRRRLHDEFEKILRSLNIPYDERSTARAVDSGLPPATVTDDGLRRLALAVLGRMTTSELRELRLPLGYVIDELQAK